MAWCRRGTKPLSEPMMVNLLMHICVTRPQCLNPYGIRGFGQHWFRPVAPCHQTITWTKVDLPSTRSSGIPFRVMFTWIPKLSSPKLCLKCTHWKSRQHLPVGQQVNIIMTYISVICCLLLGPTLANLVSPAAQLLLFSTEPLMLAHLVCPAVQFIRLDLTSEWPSELTLMDGKTSNFMVQSIFNVLKTHNIEHYHLDGTGNWNYSSWKTRICLSCTVKTMAADGMGTQRARASKAMVLT